MAESELQTAGAESGADDAHTSVTVGELLVRCLALEGVDFMCGIVDGAHIPFVRHTGAYGISYVNTRHEEAAAHVAEAYTRLAHRPAVVIGNPGPGGANMLAGLTSAQGEGHPVVAIACTRRAAVNSPDRGGAWQATDLVDMARPITKFSALISRADRVPDLVRAAFRAATVGRPGPAFLAIPDELLNETIDPSTLTLTPASRHRVIDVGAGDPDAVAAAAEALAAAERPFLFAGKGVLWAEASEEFVALGDHLAAAMSTTLGARGVVPEDHPHYFPIADANTLRAVRTDADVVLVVGARLGEYDGWGLPPAWGDPATQHTIQIDCDPASLGLNRPFDQMILADARRSLSRLVTEVRARCEPRSELAGAETYAAIHAEAVANATPHVLAEAEVGVNPGQLVMAVRDLFPRDAVVVADGGNTTLWAVALNPVYTPDSFLYSVKMGYLGTGLPFAIGAKLAAPDRCVYLISGDGAFGFNAMELETARRVGAAVVCIVVADDGWGMERTAHRHQGVPDDQLHGTELSSEVRYDHLARALGCHGEYVDTMADLALAVERARASGLPAVIHVKVDPALNANPIGYDQFRAARTY
ncbi:MAG: thiamine pyrophosphate-binding protein [Microthrixaceae bacterium]|nr:thiamine pyrophosphate-binding protein [Microthrixaceae bacterium]